MNLENYELNARQNATLFEFESCGTRGRIRKQIIFQQMRKPGVYNLAFGDLDTATREIDDKAISNNGDTEKVLITVVRSLYIFFTRFPKAFVYAAGSTASRTRLYRIYINRYRDEMKKDFYLYGYIKDELFLYEPGRSFDGFLIRRKPIP